VSQHAPMDTLPLFAPPDPASARGSREDQPRAEWTPDERRVYRALLHHQGAASAIKCDDLADAVGLRSRALQGVIHDLIHRHGIAVGSSMREPYGYYLAASEAELEDVARMFDRRAEAIQETGEMLRQRGKDELRRRIP